MEATYRVVDLPRQHIIGNQISTNEMFELKDLLDTEQPVPLREMFVCTTLGEYTADAAYRLAHFQAKHSDVAWYVLRKVGNDWYVDGVVTK